MKSLFFRQRFFGGIFWKSIQIFFICVIFLGNKSFIQTAYADINTNLIPTMTSNTAPSGIASASGQYTSSYAPWYAFAYNLPNGDQQTWATPGNTGWLQYQFPVAHVVTKYDITNRDEVNTRSPTSWTFQGSNDGTNWTVLDTQTNITSWSTTRNVTMSFSFINSIPYTHYRIQVQNSDAYIGI